jgi:hypothetical protein
LAVRAELQRAQLLLGEERATAGDGDQHFARESELLAPGIVRDARAPNPFYSHLFAAFRLQRDFPELELPDLDTQCARWGPWADPLEQGTMPFGLTPYGTLQRFRCSVQEHLERPPLEPADLASVRLRSEVSAFAQVRDLLAAHHLGGTRPEAELRELWLLLCSFRDLFVCLR